MTQHVIIAIIFFLIGTAWGFGIHGMMVANDRRKRIQAARDQRINPITDPRRKDDIQSSIVEIRTRALSMRGKGNLHEL